MTINIIDLFSGGGGLTEGFRSPRTNIIAHVEMDKNACKTLQRKWLQSYEWLSSDDFSVFDSFCDV